MKEPQICFECREMFGDMAVASRIFNDWLKRLDPRFGVNSIVITNVDFRSTPSVENILFIRLRVKASAFPHEQIVELRGGAVAMLVHLRCSDEGRIYTVLVKQPRIATGNLEFVEIPAGMIDGGSFLGAAAREIEEELGMKFTEFELENITLPASRERGVSLSPGLLDETCMFYRVERSVTRAELDELQGKTYGLQEEGEHVTLLIVPREDVPLYTSDAKTLLACYFYSRGWGS